MSPTSPPHPRWEEIKRLFDEVADLDAPARHAPRVSIDDVAVAAPTALDPVDLEALDAALTQLGTFDPRQARVVELRYFAGLTVEEAADVLDASPRTVKRDRQMARAWLRREMSRATEA